MKIIIAIDSFKGSLNSKEAGEAFASGIRKVMKDAELKVFQLSDGGEGMIGSLCESLPLEIITIPAYGPLGEDIKAEVGSIGDTLIIESAKVCGLNLIPENLRNPMYTDSGGLGVLIRYGVSHGYKRIIIGLGGSGVNDGGIGMMRELGCRFLDARGSEIARGGGFAKDIVGLDTSAIIDIPSDCRIIIASDVDNPLYGENGASAVFGPQKGATPQMVSDLDRGLRNFAEVTRRHLGMDLSQTPGCGAAGGIGYSLITFLKGEIQSGIETILEIMRFDKKIEGAEIVVTGEGYLDSQTLMGKAPYGVMSHSRKQGIPVVAIGGGIAPHISDEMIRAGFTAVFPIVSAPMSLAQAMNPEVTKENISRTAEMLIRMACIE
ncbi:MAG: glycerate kinase [Muribaculaceae bacterium]|nr:glycerate kinase [Muribaculaceae bacterium]